MTNHKILIVDYEPRSIQKMREPLEREGYEIVVAQDGLAGMEAFHKHKPGLVLLEAMLPKKHGFDVCQELKKTPEGKLTPILIVTSVYKGRRYRTQALHHYGANEYLEKPIAEDQLLEMVRRFIGDAPRPAAPASQPKSVPPARSASPAGPPVAGADAEQEIVDRLDTLLTGDTPRPAPREDSREENVVSFDAARSRRRRPMVAPHAAGSPGGSGGARMEPAAERHLETALPAGPLAHARAERAASPEIAPPVPQPGDVPGSYRLWLWLSILILALLTGAVTAWMLFA